MSAAPRAAMLPALADGGAAADLLAAWRPGGFLMERDGAGVVAGSEGLEVPVPAGPRQAPRAAEAAGSALADLGVDGAVVVGALPFEGSAGARLLVPEHVRVTSIAPRELDLRGLATPRGLGARGDPAPERAAAPPAGRPTAALRWTPEPPVAVYAAAVAEAVARIRAGGLEKVVLARSLVAPNPGIDLRALLAELRRRDPGCHLFAAPADGGAFVGVTPETLVRREGERVLSLPHAGTAARSTDPGEDRRAAEGLLRSAKDRHEHRPVVEAVADALAPHCSELHVDPEPHLTATATVWHLATAVRGRLRPPAPSALALAAALHPTPAVCGTPEAAARDLIARLEPRPRGLFAGLVGWVDGRGDGEWAVSLRCALVTPGTVRIDAGAGIVAMSRPDLEVAETEAKFRTIVEALEACLGTAETPA
ncbi:MAG: isochorismate synthase MenF [Candidatus Dormibacteria bacterium]